ncbi:MAG: hypothetical protein WAT81_01015 [Candidatus Moraniibacteriota bacterium]
MEHLYPEFALAESLIQAGLLQEIDAPRIKERAPNGAVLISCGDRDRFKHHFVGCTSFTDVHPICLNGGGVLLGDHVDVVRRRVLLEECVEAFAMKNLSFILDLSHFPCGKCAKLGVGFRDTVLRTLEGKAFLKRSIPTEQLRGVLPLISIDWRNAHIKQEHGVKLYATHLQNMEAIASFELSESGITLPAAYRDRHHLHPIEVRA